MFLLDTNVVSELRKRNRDKNVVGWVGSVNAADLFISAVSIGELERGIERQRFVNPSFAEELSTWLEVTLRVYENRILPMTVNIARRWGRLSARLGNNGIDIAIAATALDHGLIVVTRNVPHFTVTGVPILNPYDPPSRRKPK